MNTDTKPIMPWESQEPADSEGRVVWWSRLDGRYQIEVQRLDERQGVLRIFDHANGNTQIHDEPVGLSYGAVFGPDVADVDDWRERAVRVVDAHSA
jgi:hypothetical protein